MSAFDYSDDLIRRVLTESRVIAMIGASPRPDRPSHGVMRFLLDRGHTVYPVNPTCAGGTIHGHTVLGHLETLAGSVDMVDIFRRSAFAGAAVDEAIAIGAKTVWMQLGVIDEDAAARAERAGLTVIMDRCPVIEYRRLGMAKN
jgi:hypothetical protein